MIGTNIIMQAANAQPEGSSIGFFLGFLVIPYIIVVSLGALLAGDHVRSILFKTESTLENEDHKE